MAALQFYVNIPSIQLTASTATVVGFVSAPTNQRVKVLGYGMYFDGTTNSNQPVEIKLVTPTTGTFVSGSNAQLQEPELTETIQSTYGTSCVTQPTLSASNTYKTLTVHPQLGYEYLAPLGQEKIIAGGKTFAVSCNAPNQVDVRGYLLVEE
jgi:hypothetical protein